MLRDSIDELDVLIAELTGLRQELSLADLRGMEEDALWDVEAGLRHLARRAEARATVVRRAIELNRNARPRPAGNATPRPASGAA
ncbi:MAG: hypothetical protein HYX34_11925 [Actinobacteria bacterium]|nr:hypothetical protein [Actinomycetota bacterium]